MDKTKFAGRSGSEPIGVLDLGYWSLGCIVDPPLPPQWAPGAQKCEGQCLAWSPGPSIFRSFVGFDFGLDFGLVLGPFWARLGRLLGPFLEPKSGQVGPKIHLEAVFVQKSRCSRNIVKRKARATLFTPRRAQDGLKTGPRRVQERSKSHAFFVLNFDSFWGRLGRLLGPFWEPKSGQVGPKMRLEPSFALKCRCSRGLTFSKVLGSI